MGSRYRVWELAEVWWVNSTLKGELRLICCQVYLLDMVVRTLHSLLARTR